MLNAPGPAASTVDALTPKAPNREKLHQPAKSVNLSTIEKNKSGFGSLSFNKINKATAAAPEKGSEQPPASNEARLGKHSQIDSPVDSDGEVADSVNPKPGRAHFRTTACPQHAPHPLQQINRTPTQSCRLKS